VFNPGWNLVFELQNMIDVSEAITRSALLRPESRGAHSRLDYPELDDSNWGQCNSVVAPNPDGTMKVYSSPIPTMPDELRGLLAGDH
jgi:succinate dehydrogenase / fumarate reductase flavoprotein subunit